MYTAQHTQHNTHASYLLAWRHPTPRRDPCLPAGVPALLPTFPLDTAANTGALTFMLPPCVPALTECGTAAAVAVPDDPVRMAGVAVVVVAVASVHVVDVGAVAAAGGDCDWVRGVAEMLRRNAQQARR